MGSFDPRAVAGVKGAWKILARGFPRRYRAGHMTALRSFIRIHLLTALLVLGALAARADVPVPTIEGPVTGGAGIFLPSTTFDLARVGYMVEEYFVSGTASAYTNVGALDADGKWA